MPLGFKLIWSGLTMSDQAQLIYDSKKNQLYRKTRNFARHMIWEGKLSIIIILLSDFF